MLSIGTDIVNISRIKKILSKNGDQFLSKIYSDEEIHYCNSNSKPYIHLSGKYAAKEAIKKALISKNFVESISLKKIEILNNLDKSPYVKVENLNDVSFNISISHDSEYAIAFALIEK